MQFIDRAAGVVGLHQIGLRTGLSAQPGHRSNIHPRIHEVTARIKPLQPPLIAALTSVKRSPAVSFSSFPRIAVHSLRMPVETFEMPCRSRWYQPAVWNDWPYGHIRLTANLAKSFLCRTSDDSRHPQLYKFLQSWQTVDVTNGADDPHRADPDPTSALRRELRILHRRSGEPSTRRIARLTSDAISHTTVHAVIRCLKCPRWGQLELVVQALGGDVGHFRALWVNVRNAEDPLDFDIPKRSVGAGSARFTETTIDSGNDADKLDQEALDGSELSDTERRFETINVIISTEFSTHKWDVELPVDAAIWVIVEKIADHRDLPFYLPGDTGKSGPWDLQWKEGGRSFAPSETLRSAGVQNGATLTMRKLYRNPP